MSGRTPPKASDQPLTDAQVRREACLHCGERLDPRTAIETGRRMVQCNGRWVTVLPLCHAGCDRRQ